MTQSLPTGFTDMTASFDRATAQRAYEIALRAWRKTYPGPSREKARAARILDALMAEFGEEPGSLAAPQRRAGDAA